MAFIEESGRTPVSVDAIAVILKDAFGESGPYQSAHYSVRILFSDGSSAVRKGNLVPHITVDQRNALMGFLDSLRTQAEGEFLPET